ncbi:methyltransferase [Rhizobium laguerreae]|uniref:methyltransferase n=1 Tax=Rhizobium laguerreae TaxID=1076926 RepID=UPI0014781029|nr:methyltransferase [Rhizobium laguerreae]NNH56934.1 methyltransferase [Rhizobium laguerreae]
MAKLTKPQAKAHAQACDLLTKPVLTEDDKDFVLKNWNESANHVNGAAGAFFTPYDMAFDFTIDAIGEGGYGGRIIDLCAGIGMLSYACWYRSEKRARITCIERNPDYLAVGQKILPDAEWILADVLDVLDMGLPKFDVAISNPPFGAIKRDRNGPRYTGKDFEFHVIDIAAHLADSGTFIVPQMSAGFNYSGKQYYERQKDGKAVKFQELTGLHFEAGCGIDTAFYLDAWKGVSPLCEIVCVDFTAGREQVAAPAQPVAAPVAANDNSPQLWLFGDAA